MYIDSHCHLDFPELATELPARLARMRELQVTHALCISVTLEDFPRVIATANFDDCLYATCGVHPDYLPAEHEEPTVEKLLQLTKANPKVVAIGETGLDYFRLKTDPQLPDMDWQRNRFSVHIEAAKQLQLPLIIHTRASSEDTLRMMKEQGAGDAGGVMHCFTEEWSVAKRALDLGFYISMSGIVSFKNAAIVHEVATKVPADRLLIETDSPYLAPMPHRGKLNEPAFVSFVAKAVANLRGVSAESIGEQTTENFFRLFNKIESTSNAML
jgi:TatD DNase family protein